MSRGCSQGQTHKQILGLHTAICTQRQWRSYRQLQKVYIIPPPILINYYSIPFLGSHPAAGRYLDAGDAAAPSRALRGRPRPWAPSLLNTQAHSLQLVQQARDNRVHELLGWAALVMKSNIRIFERVYYPSTVIPRIQSY